MDEDTEDDIKRARYAVARAVDQGRLRNPGQCEQCGKTSIGGYGIVGHHHRGYDEQHALDVIWLCGLCHHRAHIVTSSRRCRGQNALGERCSNYAMKEHTLCHLHQRRPRHRTKHKPMKRFELGLRVPAELNAQVAQYAKQLGVPVNTAVILLLNEALTAER